MKRLLLVCVLASCFPAMALAQPRESAGKDATLASLVAELGTNNPMLAAARRTQGKAFDLRRFHDFVWKNGNVPISLQQWEMLNDSIDVPH